MRVASFSVRMAMAVRMSVAMSAASVPVRSMLVTRVLMVGRVFVAAAGSCTGFPWQVHMLMPGRDHQVEQVQRYREQRDQRVASGEHGHGGREPWFQQS